MSSGNALNHGLYAAFMYPVVTVGYSQVCTITAYNSDGGVLGWTKAGLPTATVTFKVFWFR